MLTLSQHVALGAPKLERKELYALIIALARFVADTHERGQTVDDLRPDSLELEEDPRSHETVVVKAPIVEDATAHSPEAVLARSPEQLRDAAFTSKRSDVYGAAVLIYRLAAGRPPFNGESFHEMLLSIADNAAVPLETLRPDLGATLGAVVRQAMSADAALRFADGQELLSALEEAREAGPVTMPTAIGSGGVAAPPSEEESELPGSSDDAAPEADARAMGRWGLQLSFAFLVVFVVIAVGYRYLAPSGRALPNTSPIALEAARAAASEYRDKAASSAPAASPAAPSASPAAP